MKPTQPYRALRAVVGSAIIATVLALWAHGQLTDQPLDMLWDVVVLGLLIASGIAVFGRRTMQTAVDAAQDITNDDGSSGGQSGDAGDHQEGSDAAGK